MIFFLGSGSGSTEKKIAYPDPAPDPTLIRNEKNIYIFLVVRHKILF